MEKQGSTRVPVAFTRRDESMRPLAPGDRKRMTATLGATDTGETTASPMDDRARTAGLFSGTNVGNGAAKKFDQLEALGPSLLEVLTLVRPPAPSSQSQQDAEEDASETMPHSTSYEELQEAPQIDPRAKFDLCLSRSAIVARVVDASVDNTRKVQEFFARTLEKLQCEATGIVLLQESTVFVFLETTADEFLRICEQLHTPQQTVMDRASLKVLASCDDNGVRLLQGLYFRKISITRAASDAGEWTDDTLRQVCVDAFLGIVKFVKKIGPMAPAEIRKILTNLSNSDQMLLPSNELLLWLMAHDDVMPLGEFLEVYNSPIHLELESERVWPVHPLVSY
jgi:hypothetical protein